MMGQWNYFLRFSSEIAESPLLMMYAYERKATTCGGMEGCNFFRRRSIMSSEYAVIENARKYFIVWQEALRNIHLWNMTNLLARSEGFIPGNSFRCFSCCIKVFIAPLNDNRIISILLWDPRKLCLLVVQNECFNLAYFAHYIFVVDM